jgi:AraC-like DNA-binding protein
LFGYCAFAIERLASVQLPHPSIIIVLTGSKEIWLGDDCQRLQAGEAFALPANLDFGVVNIPDERIGLYEALVLEVPALPAGLIDKPVAPARTPRTFDICVPLTPDLVDALEHAAITLADSSHAKALAEHRLAEVLLLVQDVPAARPLFVSSLADQVSWLLLGAPSHNWTAAEIATKLGIGASTLRRRLAADGQSLRQVMRDCRMNLARSLLTAGHSNVAQAAEAAGYTSRSHFARRFRHAHGVSPSRVRAT